MLIINPKSAVLNKLKTGIYELWNEEITAESSKKAKTQWRQHITIKKPEAYRFRL
jgi:hypothetical protein